MRDRKKSNDEKLHNNDRSMSLTSLFEGKKKNTIERRKPLCITLFIKEKKRNIKVKKQEKKSSVKRTYYMIPA